MNDEYVNVVGITFKKYGKKYYFDCHNLNLRKNLTVIVETERGLQFGTVITDIIKMDKKRIHYPLKSVIKMLKDLYSVIPETATIRCSGVTGYGEALIKTALNVDLNEIETIAHYTAAKKFMPNVTSIVDIGGQDMKYIKLKNNSIDNIMLNEACSSGCGSFIETFAKMYCIYEFKNKTGSKRRL